MEKKFPHRVRKYLCSCEPNDWEPFLLDHPMGWAKRRFLEHSLNIPPASKSDSEERIIKMTTTAISILADKWECPCGNQVDPVWIPGPVDDLTFDMLTVFLPEGVWEKERDSFLEGAIASGKKLSAKDRILARPVGFDAAIKRKSCCTLRNGRSKCELLRALHDMTKLPWLDRTRALYELVPDILGENECDEAMYAPTADEVKRLGVMHMFFPQPHHLNERTEQKVAAIMAIINLDAEVVPTKPDPTTVKENMIVVEMPTKYLRYAWIAVSHLGSPWKMPKRPFYYAVFPVTYLISIQKNDRW